MSRKPSVEAPVPLPKTSTRDVLPVESLKNRMAPPPPPPRKPLANRVALPAVEVLKNSIKPPPAPLTVPPLLVKVPLPAVEVSTKNVPPPLAPLTMPPLLVKAPLSAVALLVNCVKPPFAPLTVPALLMKAPLPAVDVPKNSMKPPNAPLTALPMLVKRVKLPAVALFVNAISPALLPAKAAIKFCVIPELFVMPTPLMVNVKVAGAVIVKAFSPALDTMALTSVLAERETPVLLEVAKVAVSDGPLGMVAGVQLAA